MAKFKKSSEAIGNYIVRIYDSSIMLTKGIREGKLPVMVLDPVPRKKTRKKRRRRRRKQ